MSKIISFFLASSIKDVEYDRLAVGDFINQMNNMYKPMDIFIRLYKCEDESMDHSIMVGGSQKSLDDLICESDICFVIFWRKAGKVTCHELDVAFKAYKAHNKPKVIVYFKTIENKSEVPDDVKQIMNIIDNEMKHYHREYSHVDSLKLGIITQLNVNGFIKTDLSVENDEIMAQGQRIASTSDIPLFSENAEYMELVAKYHEAADKCDLFLSQYNLDKTNNKVYRAYQKASKERDRISEDIAEMVNGMFSIGSSLARIASSSEVNDRIREAIKCFDEGDYDGVLDILNPDEIENQITTLNEMEEKVLIESRTLMESMRLRILALEAKGKWNELYKEYEDAVSLVTRKPEMPKTIILEYARFLEKQRKPDKSIEKCEWLMKFYELYPDSATQIERFELLKILGALYFDNMRYEDAENVLNQAITLLKDSPEDAFEVISAKISLAKVYFKVNRYRGAESLYNEALEFYKAHDNDDVQHVDVLIADTSLELGDVYYMINRHEDAEKLFLSAYEKYKMLVLYGDSKYREKMAIAGDKAARLALSVFSHQTSDNYYVESMIVKESLTEKDPSEYMKYYIRICEKLAKTWKDKGNPLYGEAVQKEADSVKSALENDGFFDLVREDYRLTNFEYYRKPINKELIGQLCRDSLNIYNFLAKDNPEAYEPLLAQSYNTAGIYYSQIGEIDKAEKNYKEAIEIREILAKRSRQLRSNLAASYSNYSYDLYVHDKCELSEQFGLKAIEIYENITTKKAGAFSSDLARNYNYMGKLYTKMELADKAQEYFYKSLTYYFELYKNSPRAFVDRIINTVANVITLLDGENINVWMDEFINI